MKIAIDILLILAAIACLLLGFLVTADPEGRSGPLLLKFWGAAVLCIGAVVARHVWWA